MKTAKKYNPDLILHGNLIHAILSLAIPVVINSFLQTMYNLTDTYWLGKIGTEQLAAINLVTPMQNIITNFGSGITDQDYANQWKELQDQNFTRRAFLNQGLQAMFGQASPENALPTLPVPTWLNIDHTKNGRASSRQNTAPARMGVRAL